MDPVYEPAYFEDLAGRLYGLVISFSGRLPADQAQWLHHVVDVGEYGLALEDLAAMLAYGKIAISDQERGGIAALARQMGMDPDSARPGPGWPGPAEDLQRNCDGLTLSASGRSSVTLASAPFPELPGGEGERSSDSGNGARRY